METLISSLAPQHVFPINHASDVAAARRAGQKLADDLDFDDVQAGRLAIVITEAGTNILKHAGDGTAGTGLGALRRQSDEFDVWSQRGKGAAFFMRLWRGATPPAPCGIEVGALRVPLAGEDACGDGWAATCDPDGATLLAVDGLGHGPEAAKAADAAVKALERSPAHAPEEVMQRAHEALRITRGAALSVARIGYAAGELRFAGIGNVACIVASHDGRRTLVSHNGIVGHNMRKVQEFTVPFAPGTLCVLHSDGLQTQWDLDDYPGLHARAPAIVAGILMRDFIRLRDDALVLVARRIDTGKGSLS